MNVKCPKCSKEAGLVRDGPLTLRICPVHHQEWLNSEERRACLELVGKFLGRVHPPAPIKEDPIIQLTKEISAGYTRGLRKK